MVSNYARLLPSVQLLDAILARHDLLRCPALSIGRRGSRIAGAPRCTSQISPTTFTCASGLPAATSAPVQRRRLSLVAKLEEQKQLLKDPHQLRVTQWWTKVDGERQPTTRRHAVPLW
jgi:hypothetical protein